MTVSGISIAHHQALAEQDAARVNEIRELGVRRSRARVSLEVAEQLLAARLYYFHEGGLAVDELAAAAGLTRKQALEAIDRYRRELGPPGGRPRMMLRGKSDSQNPSQEISLEDQLADELATCREALEYVLEHHTPGRAECLCPAARSVAEAALRITT